MKKEGHSLRWMSVEGRGDGVLCGLGLDRQTIHSSSWNTRSLFSLGFPSLNNRAWVKTVWCKYCSTYAIKQESNRPLYPKTLGQEQNDFPSPSTQFRSSHGIISHGNYYISNLQHKNSPEYAIRTNAFLDRCIPLQLKQPFDMKRVIQPSL